MNFLSFPLQDIVDDLQGDRTHQKSGRAVVLTLIESTEKSLRSFTICVIEGKKHGERRTVSWTKWSLGLSFFVWRFKIERSSEGFQVYFSISSVTSEVSYRVLQLYFSQETFQMMKMVLQIPWYLIIINN